MNIYDGNIWMPVFQSTVHNAERQESYWPVGMNEQQFFCVICKGAQKYPTFPKPILCDFPLQIPFTQLDSANSGLEEK